MTKTNRYIKHYTSEEQKGLFYQSAVRLEKKFETDAYVKEGIVRWKSNDRVPPLEEMEFWAFLEKPFDFDRSLSVQKEETKKSLEEYRMREQNRQLSDEERYEMTAAFGKGATIVNVLTGTTFKL